MGRLSSLMVFTALLAACGGDDAGPTPQYAVGGSVSGLAGSGLTLQNNGADSLTVAANGTFTFANPIPSGAAYNVTIADQPTGPSQTCTISKGSGTAGVSDTTNVSAVCTTNSYTVGGNAGGLIGTGMELQINGGDDLPIATNGAFLFTTPVDSGQPYVVTVKSQPSSPSQTCVLKQASGTVTS